jgi:ribosomal protein L40E
MLTQSMELNADKQCHACAAELIARARFCRRCGARQMDANTASARLNCLAECETRPLTEDTREFQSYSGQLIKIVTQSMSARTAPLHPSRGLQRLLCTLITLPIWMLIVLLSPLDAYVAAKAAADGMNHR